MAHKKVDLKRIANDKTRMITYKKRKACLYKKAMEFSTLCGIDTCLIVYGPTKATDEVISEPEIWPRDETKVRDIIRKYRETVSNSCRKANHVETFVNDLGKEKETGIKKRVMRSNKYCIWEEKLDKCSQEQLIGIFCDVENKLHEAVTRQYHSVIRVQHQVTETPITQCLMDQHYNMQQYVPEQQRYQGSMFTNNMGFSLGSSHDDQIQMDTNLVENFTELGMMIPKENDGTHWTQRQQTPYYNVEAVLQRPVAFNTNPYQVPFNIPWRLTGNQ